MEFKITPIKPSMTHEEKVYEYARRIAHYSVTASSERELSKKFACSMIKDNLELTGVACGCTKRESSMIAFERSIGNFDYVHKIEKCHGCKEASKHYDAFREAKSKQGAAMRQLANEMKKHNKESK